MIPFSKTTMTALKGPPTWRPQWPCHGSLTAKGLWLMRLRTIDAPPLMTVCAACEPQKSETPFDDQGHFFHLFSISFREINRRHKKPCNFRAYSSRRSGRSNRSSPKTDSCHCCRRNWSHPRRRRTLRRPSCSFLA